MVEIYDHHEDAREYLWVSDDKRQIAFQSANDDGPSRALVASTCTLVAEKARKNGGLFVCVDMFRGELTVILFGSSVTKRRTPSVLSSRWCWQVSHSGAHIHI